jgi:maleylacetoacetate isomerase
MRLYIDPRSSASLRVLCYLAYKGLSVPVAPLRLMAGEHLQADYGLVNPARAVPALEADDGTVLTQSLAIMELFEQLHPEPPALPAEPLARARVRALCGLVACEMHPLTNMRVRRAVAQQRDEAAALSWCRHWTRSGLAAAERMLDGGSGFCFGPAPGMADFLLAPQALNAIRFGCDLAEFPRVRQVYWTCQDHPAFAALIEAAQA